MATPIRGGEVADTGAQFVDGIRLAAEVRLMAVAELLPYARNSRKHSPAQIEAIAANVRRVGWTNPLLIADGMILAGHGRLEAAKKLGLSRVPCVDLSHLSPEERRAQVVWDNRSAELGSTWDLDMLKLETDELRAAGLDLEEMTGFGEEDLANLFQGMPEETPEANGDPDDVPPVPNEPFSRLGDVWVIGPHRVMCGSSLEQQDWARLMGNDMADLVFTDPPYGVSIGEKNDSMAKAQGRTNKTGGILNDDLQGDALYKFLLSMFNCVRELMKPGAAIYVYHADTEGIAFRTAFRDAGFHLQSILQWRKNTFVLSRWDHHPIAEPAIYGWKKGAAHRWFGGRKQHTFSELGAGSPFQQMEDGRWRAVVGDQVFIVDGEAKVEVAESSVFHCAKPAKSELHPTQKPVDLVRRHLRNSGRRGDIVVDAFGGSGSTTIAAHMEGMGSRLMELDPKYVDVIVRRAENLIGVRAVHAVTGEPLPLDGETRPEAPPPGPLDSEVF